MPLVSQNELGGLTEKAWRGLSISHPVPWGLAKDSNNMVQWLASRQLSFADSLIECLAMVKANPELAQTNPLESGVLVGSSIWTCHDRQHISGRHDMGWTDLWC